jgi:hypothetical protein
MQIKSLKSGPRALQCEGISAEKEIPTQTGCVEEEEDQ